MTGTDFFWLKMWTLNRMCDATKQDIWKLWDTFVDCDYNFDINYLRGKFTFYNKAQKLSIYNCLMTRFRGSRPVIDARESIRKSFKIHRIETVYIIPKVNGKFSFTSRKNAFVFRQKDMC